MSSSIEPSTRLLLALGLLLGGAVTALGGWEFAGAEDRVVAASRARAEAVGKDLQGDIDAPYLETLASILPDREAVWSWDGHGDDLRALHTTLATAADRHGFARVRTLRPRDDVRTTLRKAGGEPHRAALDTLVSAADKPDWRKPVDYQPEMREPWRHGRAASRVTHSRHGTMVETWLPLTDRLGDPVALLELTDRVDEALSAARTRAAFVTGLGLLVAGLAVGVAVREAGRFENRAALLRRVLRRLSAGKLDEAIVARGDPILTAAEQARTALKGQLQGLQAQLDEAQGRLRTAEAMMDPRTQERREAIARVATGPILVLDAGGSRREQAELVDLSFVHLVVRVQKYTMIDLAPGMPSSVAWVDQESAAVELPVTRRIETEEGVEYVFSLDGEGELPGTPPEIACIAFARAAERASAEFTEVTATLLAGLGGSLVAEVKDLSADGAGLYVPVPASSLTATGTRTTLVIQLAVDEPEMTFGVVIRAVREHGDRTFIGLQFDAETTADFDARRACVAGWVDARIRALALEASGMSMDFAA